jgi:hypothetical protein
MFHHSVFTHFFKDVFHSLFGRKRPRIELDIVRSSTVGFVFATEKYIHTVKKL